MDKSGRWALWRTPEKLSEAHMSWFNKRSLKRQHMTTGILSARVFVSMLIYLVPFSIYRAVWPKAFHRWGPTSTIESPDQEWMGVTIKVKWEVHSCPFKGFSWPPQSLGREDEWCRKGQGSFVGPQCRVSERVQGQHWEFKFMWTVCLLKRLENKNLAFLLVKILL